MSSAQGSLEYLIIIAVVLAVSAIVIMYTTGIIGGQKSSVSVSSCKQAAANCQASRFLSPNDPCLACDTACKDSTGVEIFNGATYCCNHTQTNLIYAGSLGCGGGYSYGGSRTVIYSDSFSNLSGWIGQLSSSCTDTGGWCIGSGQTGTGANMSSHGTYSINRTQPTVGYSGIQISFQAAFCGDVSSGSIEYLQVDWSGDGGSTWNTLLHTTSIFTWTPESYTLPASADENPNFVVRITAYDSHGVGGNAYACANSIPKRSTGSQVDELYITGLSRS